MFWKNPAFYIRYLHTQQTFQRCFNVVFWLMRLRDVGQRQINEKQRCVFQRWNLQRRTTLNQHCVFQRRVLQPF